MYFTASTVAILALAAGSQAGVPKKGEPPVLGHKAVTPVSTGSHPIMTGMNHAGSNSTGGRNSTVTVTSSALCPNCPGSSTIPVSVPSMTSAASEAAASRAAAAAGAAASHAASSQAAASGATASEAAASGAAASEAAVSAASGARPSSSAGFTPSNPGAKVAVPMAGVLGSVAYGLLLV